MRQASDIVRSDANLFFSDPSLAEISALTEGDLLVLNDLIEICLAAS